jgi:hypothetical protein
MSSGGLATLSGEAQFRLYLFGAFRLERHGQPERLPTRWVKSRLACPAPPPKTCHLPLLAVRLREKRARAGFKPAILRLFCGRSIYFGQVGQKGLVWHTRDVSCRIVEVAHG